MTPIDIVIADDHPPTRAGVRAALEADGFRVVGEVASGPAAVAATREHRPAVCLLDVEMPGGDGITAAETIAQELPDTAIVMLTVSVDDDTLFRALRAGAAGYLLKETDPARLGDALRGVLAGEAAIPRTLVARLVTEFRQRGRGRLDFMRRRGLELTEREWEVLELLIERRTTKQIAAHLGVSQVTVRRHVSGLLAKMKVPDREAAIRVVEEAERAGF